MNQSQKFFQQCHIQKEWYLERTTQLENIFSQYFFSQCIESAVVELQEQLFFDHTSSNYFQRHVIQFDTKTISRFFQWFALYLTLQTQHTHACTKPFLLTDVYYVCNFQSSEQHVANVLSGMDFKYLIQRFATYTHIYLQTAITPIEISFLMQFWYNVYERFLHDFTCYVPFVVRLQKNNTRKGSESIYGNKLDTSTTTSH